MNLDPFNLLAHIVNVIILYLVLKKILYKPVTDFLKKRESQFQQKYDDLQTQEKEVEALKQEYQKKIQEAKEEAAYIVKQANELAEERSTEIINEARKQAQDLLERTREEIDRERKQVQESLKTETVTMAIEIASKIIQKEISVEDNLKVIDDFLNKVV